MPLRRLEVFCLVVDEGGATRAAERLMIAQPGVSAQVRELERTLGATLFARAGSTLTLTEAGERVYRWAKEVLAGSIQVQRDVDELSAGSAGTLTIASSMAIGTYLLPPLMTRLRAERAGADITVRISEPGAALRSTEIGDVDFAVITWVDQAVPTGIHGEHLWDEPLLLCATPHGPPDGDMVDIAEIVGLPLVGVPSGVAFDTILDTQLRHHGVERPTPVIRLGHAEAIKNAVIDNDWVCLASAYAVAREISSGQLRAVRIRDADLVESIGLYHRSAKYFSPLQRAALDTLRRVAAEKADSPAGGSVPPPA